MTTRTRQVRKTLLVVGEGDSEEAFLRHLRHLYCSGGAGVTVIIRNAHGKGPENVISHAAGLIRNASFDQRVALLDTDIRWSDQVKKKARKSGIEMIGSTPCLEGLLLSIIGKQPPAGSADCKRAIQQLLNINLTEWEAYAAHFPRAVLDSARKTLHELDKLLGFFDPR